MAPATGLPGGILPPIVTPLDAGGEPDAASIGSLVEYEIAAGVDGLVPLGSTGENAQLTPVQRRAVLAAVIERTAGRVPVVAGLPPLGTASAVDEGRDHARAGADALLVSAPASTPYSADELRRHFTLVAEAVEIPVVAYEVPPRVHVRLGVELLAELAREGVIGAIKDSSGDLPGGRSLVEATRGIAGLRLWTGSEETVDAALLIGFDGAVPGLANVAPQLHVALARAARTGDWDAALAAQGRIVALTRIFATQRAGASASFSARAIGAFKEALAAQDVIAHATLAPPFAPDDGGQRMAVAEILADVLGADVVRRP